MAAPPRVPAAAAGRARAAATGRVVATELDVVMPGVAVTDEPPAVPAGSGARAGSAVVRLDARRRGTTSPVGARLVPTPVLAVTAGREGIAIQAVAARTGLELSVRPPVISPGPGQLGVHSDPSADIMTGLTHGRALASIAARHVAVRRPDVLAAPIVHPALAATIVHLALAAIMAVPTVALRVERRTGGSPERIVTGRPVLVRSVVVRAVGRSAMTSRGALRNPVVAGRTVRRAKVVATAPGDTPGPGVPTLAGPAATPGPVVLLAGTGFPPAGRPAIVGRTGIVEHPVTGQRTKAAHQLVVRQGTGARAMAASSAPRHPKGGTRVRRADRVVGAGKR